MNWVWGHTVDDLHFMMLVPTVEAPERATNRTVEGNQIRKLNPSVSPTQRAENQIHHSGSKQPERN
jgi:hypothetical protein